jgi:hypothetical protein
MSILTLLFFAASSSSFSLIEYRNWIPRKLGVKYSDFNEDYSRGQLMLNRIRDCTVNNKANLLQLINSREASTSTGRENMDAIVESLILSSLLHRPASSWMLNGVWVKQGHSRREIKHIIDSPKAHPLMMTYKEYLLGLVKTITQYDIHIVDDSRMKLKHKGTKVVCGKWELNLKTSSEMSSICVHFLDPDMMITSMLDSSVPEVFSRSDDGNLTIRDGTIVFKELGKERNDKPRYSSLLESILFSIPRRIFVFVYDAQRLIQLAAQAKCEPGPGLIGIIDWQAEAPPLWATEDDVLAGETGRGLVVQDALSGKLLKKFKGASYK